jgi:sarcosine oxidase subunit alpha
MFYEPFIRRAAGLGRAVHLRDPDRYETRHAHTDVLVVGSGPAGLAAARAAAECGARVTLVEQDFLLGGSLLSERSPGLEAWRAQMESAAADLGVTVLRRTTAFGLYDDHCMALVERRDALDPDPARGLAREVVITMHARTIVFATGATERPLVFGDNDLPGVMLASAARTYLNRFAIMPGTRIVLGSNNDSVWCSAIDLAAAGAAVTVVEQRPAMSEAWRCHAALAGLDIQLGARIVRARGGRAVEAAVVERAGEVKAHTHACDLIAMSGGWSPGVHLTSHTGPKPVFRPEIDAFVPGRLGAGQFVVGAAGGSFGTNAAIEQGFRAGSEAAANCGYRTSRAGVPIPAVEDPDLDYGIEPAEPASGRRRGKSFVDFQNDVTVDDLVLAHQEGYESVEHLKRYTTLGMGTDQGKTSNVNAVRMMARLRGLEMAEAGTTTFRPPYSPVSIGALAGRNVGAHFRPTRRSSLHDWHLRNGAVMIEAGPWLRPWYYRWAGERVEQAYIEEMKLVRRAVGISDVSSLGKIDVQGPDVGEFLNRVYVNGFAKLPVGKARYGVMLNDDATVLDDGTTARFSESRFFMTTTTAQAAEVMSRLEFLLQTAWQDLRVSVTSVTDQWAGMSVAGPRARAVLEAAFPMENFSNEALPHMGCRELDFDGVTLRVVRLSFSGELAYEVYCPAGCGIAVWSLLLERGAAFGIQPYGLEALASLRIEKGHVAGLELDHRNTLSDLGLGRMAANNKAFVGRELSQRSGLLAADRWSLVGIECLDPKAHLRGGSILFAATDRLEGHGRGYITSVTWSTELDRCIALGLYQGGLSHVGEEIVCAFPLKGEQVRARIVSPAFVDPEGKRLHA